MNNESWLTRNDRKKLDLFEIIIRNINGLTRFLLRILMKRHDLQASSKFQVTDDFEHSRGRGSRPEQEWDSARMIRIDINNWVIQFSRKVRESTNGYLSGITNSRDRIQEVQSKEIDI